MGREWQAASGSSTLHLIDTEKPKPRSGPRAACGRYPQRNAEHPWFALRRDEGIEQAARRYQLTFCDECEDAEATP
jgi:hypothetical protein